MNTQNELFCWTSLHNMCLYKIKYIAAFLLKLWNHDSPHSIVTVATMVLILLKYFDTNRVIKYTEWFYSGKDYNVCK